MSVFLGQAEAHRKHQSVKNWADDFVKKPTNPPSSVRSTKLASSPLFFLFIYLFIFLTFSLLPQKSRTEKVAKSHSGGGGGGLLFSATPN